MYKSKKSSNMQPLRCWMFCPCDKIQRLYPFIQECFSLCLSLTIDFNGVKDVYKLIAVKQKLKRILCWHSINFNERLSLWRKCINIIGLLWPFCYFFFINYVDLLFLTTCFAFGINMVFKTCPSKRDPPHAVHKQVGRLEISQI